MRDSLPHLLASIALLSLALTLTTHVVLVRKLGRRRAKLRTGPLPPISVLKPLKGVDEDLFDNLASFARLDYPELELVLGAEDPHDPALDVAQRLRRAFPAVAIRVVSGARPLGANPKVTNLAMLLGYARHEYFLISDSNVRVSPDYLRAIASELADPDVGLVNNLIAGTGERTVGALMENLQLASFVGGTVASADLARHPCVVGKSMLMSRQTLAAIGGFEGVRDVLAEDYVLGQRVHASGRRVVLSPHVIETVNVDWPVRRFLERHLRWGQMRRQISLTAYAAEPLLNPVPLCLALIALVLASAAELVAVEVSSSFALLGLAGAAMKCGSEAWVTRRLRGRTLPLRTWVWIVAKDLLLVGIWCVGMVRRRVVWRGTVMTIGPGTVLTPAVDVAEGTETTTAR
jgi:ceramide glucosyltransferase